MPLRHALDLRLQHLLMPDQVAKGILRYRKHMGSKHIKALITKDGKRNSRALGLEVDKGMDIFRQWWVYEPPAEEGYRQPQHLRHSDLGYAVLRSAREILALQSSSTNVGRLTPSEKIVQRGSQRGGRGYNAML